MEINTHEEFVAFIQEDRHLKDSIRSSFESTYFELMKSTPFGTLNEVSATHIWDDIITDAFTEDVVYNNPENLALEYLIENFSVYTAFTQ
jgi:hypothetical protein